MPSLPVEVEELSAIMPRITISDDNLFDSEAADVSIDFDIRYVVSFFSTRSISHW